MSKRVRIRGWRNWHPAEAIGKAVLCRATQEMHMITAANDSCVKVDGSERGVNDGSGVVEGPWRSYDDLKARYEQLDGTPCGVWGWIKS